MSAALYPNASLPARRPRARVAVSVCACLLLVLCAAARSRAATFTVVSTGNNGDRSIGDGICSSTGGGSRPCTLRAAIEEANGLAGTHTINFNITGGAAGSPAVISVTGSLLPSITSAGLTIDGTTQTNTVTGQLGAGGAVGVTPQTLSRVDRPDIQITNGGGFALGLDIRANDVTVRGISIYGFGTTANNDDNANIRVVNVTGAVIERNFVGLAATTATFNSLAAATSAGDNIRSAGADNGTIQNNLIGYSSGKGIQLGGGGLGGVSTGWVVEFNEVRYNGIGNPNLDGIDIENGSGNCTVRANLFVGNEAPGVDMYHSTGGNTIEDNTVTGNGIGSGANVETPGVRLYGNDNVVRLNVINANFGAGVMVTGVPSANLRNLITRNSIYANGTITNKAGAAASGQIGIDLQSASESETVGASPFVTVNDATDGDTGGNGLLNFPVVSSAVLNGTSLIVSGYARPGSAVEFFVAAADPRGFGEGQTYLFTANEGSAADSDSTSGAYTSPFNGQTVGADNTNRFKFTVTVPVGVGVGTALTATATSGSNTSEFSNNVAVVLAPDIELRKCVVSGATCIEGTLSDVQPGTDLTYRITFTNRVASGGLSAQGLTVVDIIPPGTQFKVGSMAYNRNTTSLGIPPAMEATNLSLPNPDPTQPPLPPPSTDPSWGYTPTGTYDPAVKFIRWRFLSGSVPSGANGSVSFIVRVP